MPGELVVNIMPVEGNARETVRRSEHGDASPEFWVAQSQVCPAYVGAHPVRPDPHVPRIEVERKGSASFARLGRKWSYRFLDGALYGLGTVNGFDGWWCNVSD